LEGYNPDADLGDTVIDLGSGAGNHCFVARNETGETGQVIGIDFTQPMLEKARTNAVKSGFTNVEFREGDIEDIPVSGNRADVIVSNCVLNLVPNKNNVFKEIFRVLKPGGHFSISDIVLIGTLPEGLQKAAEMYSGCVTGAIQKDAYLDLISLNALENIMIQSKN
jgi:ubiquinone/menaquinone biosynthesis C-methylase UbiE